MNGVATRRSESQSLTNPAVTALQEAYVREVIDTVNDLDNVLYEIANETEERPASQWQYHMIDFVKQYEGAKPKQHPVGMTVPYPGSDDQVFDSDADWISPVVAAASRATAARSS